MAAGICSLAAIALTNLADTPLLAEHAGEALVGTGIDEAAVAAAARRAQRITSPAADGHGPVEFRVHLAGVMVRRAIVRAKERTG